MAIVVYENKLTLCYCDVNKVMSNQISNICFWNTSSQMSVVHYIIKISQNLHIHINPHKFIICQNNFLVLHLETARLLTHLNCASF